jgi:hypothetical protein
MLIFSTTAPLTHHGSLSVNAISNKGSIDGRYSTLTTYLRIRRSVPWLFGRLQFFRLSARGTGRNGRASKSGPAANVGEGTSLPSILTASAKSTPTDSMPRSRDPMRNGALGGQQLGAASRFSCSDPALASTLISFVPSSALHPALRHFPRGRCRPSAAAERSSGDSIMSILMV